MKKNITAGAVFAAVFIAVYLAACFAVPGMRIKLAAPPTEYFCKSVRHMAFVKSLISFAFAFFAAVLTKAALERR